jgi:hypothetical protein
LLLAGSHRRRSDSLDPEAVNIANANTKETSLTVLFRAAPNRAYGLSALGNNWRKTCNPKANVRNAALRKKKTVMFAFLRELF